MAKEIKTNQAIYEAIGKCLANSEREMKFIAKLKMPRTSNDFYRKYRKKFYSLREYAPRLMAFIESQREEGKERSAEMLELLENVQKNNAQLKRFCKSIQEYYAQ